MLCYVLNLDRDIERMSSILERLASEKWLEIVRVAAVCGSDLPSLARGILAGSHGWAGKKGELGCFLSHVKTWELIAAGPNEWSLVIEDDAVFLNISRFQSMNLPSDANFVFVNDRTSPGSRHVPPTKPVQCLPITETLKTLNRTGFGVGSDGYAISKAAAANLLDAVRIDLCFGNIDWRLLRYSVTPEQLAEFEETRIYSIIHEHHNKLIVPGWGVLKSYCLSTPLVAFATSGQSSRDFINQ